MRRPTRDQILHKPILIIRGYNAALCSIISCIGFGYMGYFANIRGVLMSVFRYSFGKPVYVAASATPETAVDLRDYETVTLLVNSPTCRTFEASVTIMDTIGIQGALEWPAYSYVRWIPAAGEIKEKGNYTCQLRVTKSSGGYEDFGAQFTLNVSDTVNVCT